jgi:hypothetical protein
MSNSTLFPELEAEYQDKLVWKSSASSNTKAQKDFNAALKKHQEAMARVKEVETYIALADKAYMEDILPQLQKQKEFEKKQVEMMCDIYLNDVIKLGKNQKECLRLMLLEKCAEGMREDHGFYFGVFLKLETTAERNHRLQIKKKEEKKIKQQFGVEIDIDELNKTNFANEEERQQHKEKFKEFFERYHEQRAKFNDQDFFGNFGSRERKKSKTQTEKEQKLAEAEKLLNTDINKLFKDLAKIIHPDREQDPEMRAKKENLMKELSNARDNMNIAEILSIKLLVDELIPDNQTNTEFNDSSIKRFVSIIKTKIKDLENTIAQKLYSHPLFEDFNSRSIGLEQVTKHIKGVVTIAKRETNIIQSNVEELASNPKTIKQHIKEFEEDRMDEDAMFDYLFS